MSSKLGILLCACFLAVGGTTACAATPNELWQDYQQHPGYVSNKPQSIPKHKQPKITVEKKHSENKEAAVEKVQQHKEEAAKESSAAKASLRQHQKEAPKSAPKVSNKPASVAKPKSSLLKPQPRPHQVMRTPQPTDFQLVSSPAGYSISLPTAYGENPLAGLPQAEGAMTLRASNPTLLCAVNIIDGADTTSFQATTPLPNYEGKHIYGSWKHSSALEWDCLLSRHRDYHGDKLLLQAQSTTNNKTYELLYVMPMAKYTYYLPLALYSMNSLQLKNL